MAGKRLAKEQVRKLLTRIINDGCDLRFTDYCEKRMLEQGITSGTEINAIDFVPHLTGGSSLGKKKGG